MNSLFKNSVVWFRKEFLWEINVLRIFRYRYLWIKRRFLGYREGLSLFSGDLYMVIKQKIKYLNMGTSNLVRLKEHLSFCLGCTYNKVVLWLEFTFKLLFFFYVMIIFRNEDKIIEEAKALVNSRDIRIKESKVREGVSNGLSVKVLNFKVMVPDFIIEWQSRLNFYHNDNYGRLQDNSKLLSIFLLFLFSKCFCLVVRFSTMPKGSSISMEEGWPKYWLPIENSVFARQQELSRLINLYGLRSSVVQQLQNELVVSLTFRLIAVRQVVLNNGKKLGGIYKLIIKSKSSLVLLVESLRCLHTYKFPNVKQCSSKLTILQQNRSTALVVLKDRCVQSLFKLILEPITEVVSDFHSFGFRKNRSAHQALAILRSQFQNYLGSEDLGIFEGSVGIFLKKKVFNWLIENLPISSSYHFIFKSWYLGGLLEDIFSYNNVVSINCLYLDCIISPVLVNFVLSGLQGRVYKFLCYFTKFKKKQLLLQDSKKKTVVDFNSLRFLFVRYAKSFIIIAPNKWILSRYICPIVNRFLGSKGLLTIQFKTSIFTLREQNLNFLGYSFVFRKRQYNNITNKYNFLLNNIRKSEIALLPQRKNFEQVCKRLRAKFHYKIQCSSFDIIRWVNPIITEWCTYFCLSQSYLYHKKLEYYLHRLAWNWARRKHVRWGKKAIASHYFLRSDSKFKIKKWTFCGTSLSNTCVGEKKEIFVYLEDPTAIVKTAEPLNYYRLPEELMYLHAYHSDIFFLWKFLVKQRLSFLVKSRITRDLLYIHQKGVCFHCQRYIFILMESVEIFSKFRTFMLDISDLSSLELVHAQCYLEKCGFVI